MATLTKNKADILFEYYTEKGWRVQPIAITYLVDVDPDTWEPTGDRPDEFNDARVLWRHDQSKIITSSHATVKPGEYWVNNPLNDEGTFRIRQNYFFQECWELGRHVTTHSNQRALLQCNDLVGYRGLDNYAQVTASSKVWDDAGAVDQHTTGNSSDSNAPNSVGAWSAGCLVGQYPSTHYDLFMATLEGSGQKKFDTAIIKGTTLLEWCKSKKYLV